ncbi:MAG: hypothetical protein LBC69_04515 [Eubacteriaceae bacterium]|jgi:flavodoxin|nr:hypothetical protein [Eubacteriaceae bacterium]
MEKGLIVYYSRGGSTEKIALDLAKETGYDSERLSYRGGKKISFVAAGAEAALKRTAEFEGAAKDPSSYEKVIFLSPVWASALSTPIRSYMKQCKGSIKSYAIIATMASSGSGGLFKEAEGILGKAAIATKAVLASDAAKGSYDLSGFAQIEEK